MKEARQDQIGCPVPPDETSIVTGTDRWPACIFKHGRKSALIANGCLVVAVDASILCEYLQEKKRMDSGLGRTRL